MILNRTNFFLGCRRPFLKRSMWVRKDNLKEFCNSFYEEDIVSTCNTCNLQFKSSECKNRHTVQICRRGIQCPGQCQVYFTVSGQYPTQQSVLENHICGRYRCKMCYEWAEDDHACSISKQKPQKDWTKLAFLSFARLTQRTDGQGKRFVPVIGCLVHEYQTRGNFLTKCYQENSDTVVEEDHQFERDYCMDNFPKNLNSNGRNTSFGKYRSGGCNYHQFNKKKCLSVVERMVKDLVCTPTHKNTTVVTSSCDDMINVLNALTANGISPKIIKKNRNILLLDIKEANVRFVDINNFHGPATLKTMSGSTGLKLEHPFFPHNLTKDNFNKVGPVPDLEFFLEFNDTTDEKLEKQEYLQMLHNSNAEYSCRTQGLQHCREKTILLATFALDYVKEAFNFQAQVAQQLGDPCHDHKKVMPCLNPLSTPFITNGAFIYGTFKLFCASYPLEFCNIAF